MKCPNCKSDKNGVYRTENFTTQKRRLRICEDCGSTFYTIESILPGTVGKLPAGETPLFDNPDGVENGKKKG